MTQLSSARSLIQKSGIRVSIVPVKTSKVKPKKKTYRRRVFVVHGRNRKAREAMDSFLYSIGLLPMYFAEARRLTGKATPFVLDVVRKGTSATRATLVLMTPDDAGCLRQPFRGTDEPAHEVQLDGRLRQNVIFEAGMAMALRPRNTVLVELGDLHTISDLAGLHTVRIDNSFKKRDMLASSLQNAKCRVDKRGNEWKHKEKGGDFDTAIQASKFHNDEKKRLLEVELQAVEGRGVEGVLEHPRSSQNHAEARKKTRRLSDVKAAAVAWDALYDHFESLGMGDLDSIPGFEVLKTGDGKLVEGRLETIYPKGAYDFRVLVTSSGGTIVSLRPTR